MKMIMIMKIIWKIKIILLKIKWIILNSVHFDLLIINFVKNKIVKIFSLGHKNMNKIIVEKLEIFKDFNTNGILNDFIVF